MEPVDITFVNPFTGNSVTLSINIKTSVSVEDGKRVLTIHALGLAELDDQLDVVLDSEITGKVIPF